MHRQSLLEYFRFDSRPSDEIAIISRLGYRLSRWSYRDLFQASASVAARLRYLNLRNGDRALLWGQNSAEWVAAFLGCLFCGVVVVPMDAIATKDFAQRVARDSGVRVALIGRGLPPIDLPVSSLVLEDLGGAAAKTHSDEFAWASAKRDDPVEIVFTSGTTAEPRGVVLTHGNMLANLEPLENEIEKYRRFEQFVHPLRFLDLLPLSHVFGQLLGILLPQILGATAVFTDTLNPAGIVSTIRDERVSVLVTVPRLAESLQDFLERDLARSGKLEQFRRTFQQAEGQHFLKRWWRFRRIRRRFGWKFWAIISGGAALPGETEDFWGRLGYAVIQGYGLTETTSLVSVNHPFRLGRGGSIGKALPGLEMKLAGDGEILVRGENVARGYLKNAQVVPVCGEDGWFHTGDIGERDAAGNLYFKGRSKNVIVTREGLNIYPQDLEAELQKEPSVQDCVVVGLTRDGNAEPCAVLLLRASPAEADPHVIVERTNKRLASFQKIRNWMLWSEPDFPRTPTQKPVLGEIKRVVEERFGREAAVHASGSDSGSHSSVLRDLLARIAGANAPDGKDPGAKLELTSVERVELLSAVEDRYQVDVSETAFAGADTVRAIEQLISRPEASAPVFHYSRWAQSWPVRVFRWLVLNFLGRPAMLLLGWPRIRGHENLSELNGPALVVANHIAFLDPAYVLEGLPQNFRRKLAVAMDGELLESMRNPPRDRNWLLALADRMAYWLVVSVYNVFPLPLHAGFRKSFAFVGDLIGRGWNVLIFPEGVLTRNGQMSSFRPGIGLLAIQLQVPVVPVFLDGIFQLKAAGKHWARPGHISVSLGAPVQFRADDKPEEVAADLYHRVAALKQLP